MIATPSMPDSSVIAESDVIKIWAFRLCGFGSCWVRGQASGVCGVGGRSPLCHILPSECRDPTGLVVYREGEEGRLRCV